MSILVCNSTADNYAGHIVATALARSFTQAQVSANRHANDTPASQTVSVWINPTRDAAAELEETLRSGGKAVVLGRLTDEVAEVLGVDLLGELDLPRDMAECAISPETSHDDSPAAVHYCGAHPLARRSPIAQRPLCRYDFANEWNNLGFGRITLDGSPWSIASMAATGDACTVAEAVPPSGPPLVYAALSETVSGAVLWFNRATGPVDSLEWRLLESFLGDYRAHELPCFPYVSEIPPGYSSAVFARLDCDEAISSARPLWDLYHQRHLPLSMAVVTGHAVDNADQRLLADVSAAGGSVVSHSVQHLPNWGGSYDAATVEARESRDWMREHLGTLAAPHYAVSPFHQNPQYAVAALADCGYQGFVGGIIANDPEYLMGRAGRVPFAPRPLISHSAQCMLHGDCYHRQSNTVDVYRQSYDQHRAAGAIFGYLDHPFSPRYQYGWLDEAERIAAHRQLIEHIGTDGVWWASVADVLDFLRGRDAALVDVDSSGTLAVRAAAGKERPPLSIHWKGCQFDC